VLNRPELAHEAIGSRASARRARLRVVRSALTAPEGIAVAFGLAITAGFGLLAANPGKGPELLLALVLILVVALIVSRFRAKAFIFWLAVEGVAFPFVRYPLHHDIVTFDRIMLLALGASLAFDRWPRMNREARRCAWAFALFAVIYAFRTFGAHQLPLAPHELPSASDQPEIDWIENVLLPLVTFLVAARLITAARWRQVALALTALGVTAGLLAMLEWGSGLDLTTYSGFSPFVDIGAGVVRIGGPYPTPSAFGAVMIICIVGTLYLLQTERSPYVGLALGIEFLSLAPTFTKTVWAAALVAIVIAVGLRKRLSSRLLLTTVNLGLAVAVIYSFAAKSTVVSQRVTSASAADNLSGRFATWHQALLIFQHWPWFGAGADQFISAQALVQPVLYNGVKAVPSPHNTFISVLAETGIVGSVSLTLLVVAFGLLIRAYRRSATTSEEIIFGSTVLAGASAYLLLSMTFTELADPPSGIFVAALLGAMAGRLNQASADRAERVGQGPRRTPGPSPAPDAVTSAGVEL
jgi:O-antigen ligase